MFIKANLFGVDLNKSSGDKVPEATGVITGCVFLMVCFIMIPFTYSDFLLDNSTSSFPHSEFVQLVAALLSITCMLLLGFADDVLDLRWRHKLLLPSMASLPLLMVYYVTTNRRALNNIVFCVGFIVLVHSVTQCGWWELLFTLESLLLAFQQPSLSYI